MVLTLIVFGNNTTYHQQAVFSIITFLKQLQSDDPICIITDQPNYYLLLGDRVSVFKADNALLETWKGPHNFFWRIKIAGLLQIHHNYPGQHILYVDADTFLYGPLKNIRQLLDHGNTLMHLRETELSRMPSKTGRIMWSQTKGRTYSGLLMNSDTAMWNAGVVAIPAADAQQILSQALEICDHMIASGVRPKLVEQLAFSMALNNKGQLREAKVQIGHYWGNKDGWNNLLSNYFLDNLFQNITVSQMVDAIDTFDFNKVPVYTRPSSTHKKLAALIGRLSRPSGQLFVRDTTGSSL